ncbi:MAG: tetratricopeptide repeat protein [Bdellovibrio sp.]
MAFLSPVEIEKLFDSQELNLVGDSSWTPLQKELFQNIEEGLFKAAVGICEKIFNAEVDTVTKVFAIQWAVAISEVIYDMNLRKHWIAKWHELNSASDSWTENYWCRYIYRDQHALGNYFLSDFSAAKDLFEKNLQECREYKYARGEMRTLYHLGLIHKCLGQHDKAFDFLSKALIISKAANAILFTSRIEEQIKLLSKESLSFDAQFNLVQSYILKNNLTAARKLTLYVCQARRSETRNWNAKSEHILLALLSYAFKKQKRFISVLKKIDDPILKLKVLVTAEKIAPLNNTLRFELELLRQSFKLDQIEDTTVVLKGINWGSSKNSDTAALVKALQENPNGLTKEEIVRKLWNTTDYDPTYHDQKIYRLINKIRKTLGEPTAISNHYNLYKISV